MSLISLRHIHGKKIEIFKSSKEVANLLQRLIDKTKKDFENFKLAKMKSIASAKKIMLD